MLPVERHKEEIQQYLSTSSRLVFTAPPGSGKSTMLPLFLAEMSEIKGEIVVLQPRRLAARSLAYSVAKMNGFNLGDKVGYQVRGDKKRGANTLISYRTDGLFLRQLLANDIKGVGAVVLDEFHERSWQADLILPLLMDLQVSQNLKIVVMSATMETDKLCGFLKCRLLECINTTYPVEIYYRHFSRNTALWERAFKILNEHLSSSKNRGDILIFMPGVFEINKTIELCRSLKNIECHSLHGSMSPEKQDNALRKSSRQKVIVCTNIAETSLTVDGVDTVIDTGYGRVNKYDPGRGIDTLNTEPVSVFSADQRAGRSGRLGPGISYRLWSQEEHSRKILASVPEVLRVDLSEVLLQVLKSGNQLEKFNWYERPDDTLIVSAEKQLGLLGAVSNGSLTEVGKLMADFPSHPRISKFLIESNKNNCYLEACYWAAILCEQSPLDKKTKLVDQESISSDLGVITDIWNKYFRASQNEQKSIQNKYKIKTGVLRTLGTALKQFSQLMPVSGDDISSLRENLVRSLLSAYGDRIAVRVDRGTLRYRFANGKTAELAKTSSVRDTEFIIALESIELNTSGKSKNLISTAVEVPYDMIEEVFLESLEFTEGVMWDEKSRTAECYETVILNELVLKKTQINASSISKAQSDLLAEKILDGTLKLKSWNSDVEKWIKKVLWVADLFPEKDLCKFSDSERQEVVNEFCAGAKSYKEVKNIKVLDYFKNRISWDDQQFVNEMTPDRIELANGRKVKVKYEDGKAPRITGFIQDFYGLDKTPTIANGRVKVLVEMLAPNRRPVHLTEDLEGFWDGVYKDIKSQLAGRYPKHKWI